MRKRSAIIFCMLMLAGCSGGGRVCEKRLPHAPDGEVKHFVTDWDRGAIARITIGGLDFYAHEDYVRELRFFEDGGWLLRYEQGSMQARNAEACGGPGSGYEPITAVSAYRFEADEGEFGAVYHWYEKPLPDVCDGNGDGVIVEYEEVAADWFRQKTPYRYQCIDEAGFIEHIFSFLALLSSV